MTYCVGLSLDTGLVFLSDSRTHAGVDQVSTFRKITVFEKAGDRVLALMAAGNLSISQSVVSTLMSDIQRGESPQLPLPPMPVRRPSQGVAAIQVEGNLATDAQSANPSLMAAPNLCEAARVVGNALRVVHDRDAEALKSQGVEFNVTLIFGGQIRGERPRLFNVYAAGNFIEATPDTPYFQIGESKYGKPILDRIVTRSASLAEGAKCALISMDSTIRSNLSVGPPLDLLCIRRDALRVQSHVSIDAEHPYFRMIRSNWGEALRHAFHELPDPDWLRSS